MQPSQQQPSCSSAACHQQQHHAASLHQPEMTDELFPYSEFTMPVAAPAVGPYHHPHPPSANTISSSNRALRSSSRRFSGRSNSTRRGSSFVRRNNNNREDATDVSITLAVDTEPSITLKGTAPLASLSSFRISSVDQPDLDLGSDSVFCEQYVDTDEEVAQFSSDSEEVVVDHPPRGVLVAAAAVEEDEEERRNVFVENPIREDLGGSESKDIPLADVNPSGVGDSCSNIEEIVEEEEDRGEEEEDPSNALPPEIRSSSLGGGNQKDNIAAATAPEEEDERKKDVMPEGQQEIDSIGSSR